MSAYTETIKRLAPKYDPRHGVFGEKEAGGQAERACPECGETFLAHDERRLCDVCGIRVAEAKATGGDK